MTLNFNPLETNLVNLAIVIGVLFWFLRGFLGGILERRRSAILQALQGLLAEQVTPSLMNLLKVLADRQRLQAFEAVMNRFLELYREQQGITLAQVRSAKPLSEAQQAALSKKVQAMAGTSKVDIDLSVDPALIGGFVVSLGSQVIDASLAGQVRRLGLALAKAS